MTLPRLSKPAQIAALGTLARYHPDVIASQLAHEHAQQKAEWEREREHELEKLKRCFQVPRSTKDILNAFSALHSSPPE